MNEKNNIGLAIKQTRIKRNMSATELCKLANVPKSSLSDWEAGKTQPSAKSFLRLLEALNVSALELIDASQNDYNYVPIQKIKIPVLGSVACGEPIYANENLECYVDSINNIKADFALWAKGDSMVEARINDGDLVFIRKQNMVNNGEIAAVLVDDEATLKKVYYEPNKNRLMLISANKNYQPFIYEGEELNKIKILGKAVAFQSNL